MEILDKIIEYGKLKAEDEIIKDIFIGVFLTYVKTRRYGLSYTYRDSLKPPHLLLPIKHRGSLRGRKAGEIISYIKSKNPLEATVGLAALNSVLEIPRDAVELKNGFGSYIVNECAGKKVAMIGYFPFMDKIREKADEFYLFEKTIDSVDAKKDLSTLSNAEILITTGTIIINHSVEEIIKKAENCRVMMVGPSTPLCPVLFDCGIDEILGMSVYDPRLMVETLSEGVIVPELKGVKKLSWKKKNEY